MEENTQNPEAFYAKLKNELEQTTVFPCEYLYKFILPDLAENREALHAVFLNSNALITEKPSSGGKYIAYSVRLLLSSADEVIHYYQEAGKIKGIVSL